MAPEQKFTTVTEQQPEETMTTSPNNFYYLSSKAVQNLPNFKYSGADLSLLYQYVLSPMAQWLVDHATPSFVAPNVITLFGLSLMLISYTVYSFYNPSLEYFPDDMENDDNDTYSLPSWIFILNGCAMLLYQTLDNMDGKQSRKTHSSSPLGLLFDHGCDAVNSMFGSANWIIAMGLQATQPDDQLPIWILVVMPMTLFYIATWEEYFTGSLILPMFNGPSEGLAGGAMLSFFTACVGVSFWQTTSWYDTYGLNEWVSIELRNADIMVGLCTILGIREMIFKTSAVLYKYGTEAMYNILPMVAIATLSLYIGFWDTNNCWSRMPRTTLWLWSGLFTEVVTQLMLDHVTHEMYQPLKRWVLLPLIVLAIWVTFDDTGNPSSYDDFLIMYTCSLWAYLLMKMNVVIHEICTVLNIWCFDIVTPRQRQNQQKLCSHLKHQ